MPYSSMTLLFYYLAPLQNDTYFNTGHGNHTYFLITSSRINLGPLVYLYLNLR